MVKIGGSLVAGIVFSDVLAWNLTGGLMFNERASPFGVEESVTRIQHNIQATGNGWSLSGLRNPAKGVQSDGGNTLPVLMVEACSTRQRSFPVDPHALQDFGLQEE